MHWSLAVAAFSWFSAKPVYGWGNEGHEMVGTIAQIHLLPSAQRAVCNILPPSEACSLAKISGWADDAKKIEPWKWTYDYHFVNPVDDRPPNQCIFGDHGWTSTRNILEGIVNATRGVKTLRGDERDFALRFLVHYLGDAHQPMHLTGRDKGGNDMCVKFNGNKESLHLVWDSLLLQQDIKTLTNYTTRLPIKPWLPPDTLELNRRIESALHGSKYDPLVRWIVVEGIHGWWQSDIEDWWSCPRLSENNQPGQSVFLSTADPPFKDPVGLPVCPYHWSAAAHQMGCDFAWRSNFVSDPPPRDIDLIEVNEPGYAGRAWKEKIIEKQLALGGIRLAAVLNQLLGSEEEKVKYGNVQLSF